MIIKTSNTLTTLQKHRTIYHILSELAEQFNYKELSGVLGMTDSQDMARTIK